MIRELRSLRKENITKGRYVSNLLSNGVIKKYISARGFVAYDTEEVKAYKKKARRGRPIISGEQL